MDTDDIPTIKPFQWMLIHQCSLRSDAPTHKRKRINTRKKADASNAISKATWHGNARIRKHNFSNNLTNRTKNSDLIKHPLSKEIYASRRSPLVNITNRNPSTSQSVPKDLESTTNPSTLRKHVYDRSKKWMKTTDTKIM